MRGLAFGAALAAATTFCGAAHAVSCVGTFAYTGSIESCTVGQPGTYWFEIYGAQGGSSAFGSAGGRGAFASGHLVMAVADTLQLLVGQKGFGGAGNSGAGGGGGGSFVFGGSSNELLIAAGGGGGAMKGTPGAPGLGANDGGAGTNEPPTVTGGAGGTGGSGGGASYLGTTPGFYLSGGGGGFSGDGQNGEATNSGGKSFTHGGAGGVGTSDNGAGGFGGGGGANGGRAGGGGGYSGGGGGLPGGGGGSFVNSAMTNISVADEIWIDNGKIVIALLAAAPEPRHVAEPATVALFVAGLGLLGVARRRRAG